MGHSVDDDEIQLNNDSGGETWLTSYADLMTLVACFFILMVAFANFEDPAFQKKAQEFSQYFSRSKRKVVQKNNEKNIQVEKPISTKHDKDKVLSSEKEPKNLAQVNKIDPKGQYKIIHSASVVFEPSKVFLTREVKDSLDVLINIVLEKKEEYFILIEGHTDDTDINSSKYPSNWELSAGRAAKIIKEFEKAGFTSDHLAALAFGNSRPLYPNRDENGKPIKKNQRLNRRVEIKVLKYTDLESKKIGPNIIFK